MSATDQRDGGELTAYEGEVVGQIAAWKSEPPNPFAEMFKRAMLPGARLVESVVPAEVVRQAVEQAFHTADLLANRDAIRNQAGVDDIEELRRRPLEECDRLANRVSASAHALSAVEGAATGAGGPLTTLIDIPLLFVLALRTILRIGHCYGYPLDRPRDRRYVLGVLLASTSTSLDVRRDRLGRLRDVEDMVLEETQQDVLSEEVASFLFQAEVFEEVPGVGAISGALLNLGFIRRVELTARRVFQERWLRDRGKVVRVEPAEAHPRVLARGWAGAVRRAAYLGCYTVGYGASLPVWLAASLLARGDNPVARGARDGAASADADAERLLARAQGLVTGPGPAPAPAAG